MYVVVVDLFDVIVVVVLTFVPLAYVAVNGLSCLLFLAYSEKSSVVTFSC